MNILPGHAAKAYGPLRDKEILEMESKISLVPIPVIPGLEEGAQKLWAAVCEAARLFLLERPADSPDIEVVKVRWIYPATREPGLPTPMFEVVAKTKSGGRFEITVQAQWHTADTHEVEPILSELRSGFSFGARRWALAQQEQLRRLADLPLDESEVPPQVSHRSL